MTEKALQSYKKLTIFAVGSRIYQCIKELIGENLSFAEFTVNYLETRFVVYLLFALVTSKGLVRELCKLTDV